MCKELRSYKDGIIDLGPFPGMRQDHERKNDFGLGSIPMDVRVSERQYSCNRTKIQDMQVHRWVESEWRLKLHAPWVMLLQ